MLVTYWDIGKMIHERQNTEGWGKGVIPRLSMDLKNELPEEKGFSERNLRSMVRFYLEYTAIWQLPVAELEKSAIIDISNLESHNEAHNNMLIGLTGWAHHLILMEKIKDLSTRYWYMQECLKNGWSRDTLVAMIKTKLHERIGKIANNFDFTLPLLHSEMAQQTLKDPYIFNFLTLNND